MKTVKRITVLILAVVFISAMTMLQAFAADDDSYKHEIRISPGNMGSIGEYDAYGDRVEVNGDKILVDGKDTGFKINDNVKDKYYVRGMKITGEDNDYSFQSIIKTQKDQDLSIVVTYGLKGKMVKYTVNYVDESGNQLLSSDVHYGMPGDYPVVSYRYVDGYMPDTYTAGKTLSENEADNVFTFTYHNASGETRTEVISQGQTGGNAGNAAGGANAGAGNAGNAAAIGDNATPLAGPQEFTDLDDNDTPLADAGKDNDQSGQNFWLWVLADVIAAAAAAGIVYAVVRKRRNGLDYEDEE